MSIVFNRPYMGGRELFYIAKAHFNGALAGDGPFTKCCHEWIEKQTGCNKSLLTHSCTAARDHFAIIMRHYYTVVHVHACVRASWGGACFC